MVNRKKSKYIYIAIEGTESFALTRRYLESVVFPKNSNIEMEIKAKCMAHYKRTLEGPMEEFRRLRYEEYKIKKGHRHVHDLMRQANESMNKSVHGSVF